MWLYDLLLSHRSTYVLHPNKGFRKSISLHQPQLSILQKGKF